MSTPAINKTLVIRSEGNNEDKEISRRFIKINHKEESKIREKLQLPPVILFKYAY